ncbi:DNA-processing protein DprA [Candidatus Omnitrophota bacterium]
MNIDKRDLILLNMTQVIGFKKLKALLDEFKTTEAIFSAPIKRLAAVEGIGLAIAKSIKCAKSKFNVDKEIDLAQRLGVDIRTIFDNRYPVLLKGIFSPPIVLYIKGDFTDTDIFSIGIVGARACTQYGRRMAKEVAGELSDHDITVVSGMARGIDTAAHKGCLSAGGRTIAVLGNGLASVYPPENKNLADLIANNGALVSEFPMKTPPHKRNFPQRNRVISGLSKAIVVVEAAKKSGALITADLAIDQGKEVFAIPGPCGSLASEGTNNLIRDGARLIGNASELIEELGVLSKSKLSKNNEVGFSNTFEESIYGLLSDEPHDEDDIVESISLSAKGLKKALLDMEMKGLVKQLPGRLYVRA